VYNKKRLTRHATIAAVATTTVLCAFWIGAPSSHSERPSPRTVTEPDAVKAILEFATVMPEFGTARQSPSTLLATKELTVSPGDTLMAMLVKAGIDRQEAHTAITALSDVYKPRDLKPGIVVTVSQTESEQGRILSTIDLDIDPRRNITVRRTEAGDFEAKSVEQALTKRTTRAGGVIHSSLYHAGQRAQLSPAVLADLIRVFSFDVDFQRDIRKNDGFEVMYDRLYDDHGRHVHSGNIQFAALTLSGKRHAIYLFTLADGSSDYFDEKGQSARKALMRTPIDGARLSSGFGKRRHPILGYNKMHRGVDFAASRGTPIYAAGNGIVVKSGRNGAYGRYVKIRHNSRYSTAYAHMKAIARKAGVGQRVTQGQVIGYVGTSGRSTGPHLHYEILAGGRRTNPMKVKMPSGKKLKGDALEDFQVARSVIDGQYATLEPVGRLAENKD